MTAAAAPADRDASLLATPNPHALEAIVRAGEHRTIVAARDIFALEGLKLWARDQPVSRALQRRLLNHRLREPLEACLRAVDGVTSLTLLRVARDHAGSAHPIARLVAPYAALLEHEVPRLPLHPAVQLLLTAAEEAGNGMLEHAVAAMLLAGAVAASRRASAYDMRLAMLAGLVHDLGEIYIHPGYLEPQRRLDGEAFRHLAVHPRVGRLLIAELTDYPAAVALAVDEHHERLDGSGYPGRKDIADVGELGCLIAVVESVLGTVAGPPRHPLTRARNGLRFVPGEFDRRFTAFFDVTGEHAAGAPPQRSAASVRESLAACATRLAQAEAAAAPLAADERLPWPAWEFAQHVARRIGLIRHAWAETGLWALTSEAAVDADIDAEAEVLADELAFRLRALHRDATLRADELPPASRKALAPLLATLG